MAHSSLILPFLSARLPAQQQLVALSSRQPNRRRMLAAVLADLIALAVAGWARSSIVDIWIVAAIARGPLTTIATAR